MAETETVLHEWSFNGWRWRVTDGPRPASIGYQEWNHERAEWEWSSAPALAITKEMLRSVREHSATGAGLNALREAVRDLLATDGGDGYYDAVRCRAAREACRALVGELGGSPGVRVGGAGGGR